MPSGGGASRPDFMGAANQQTTANRPDQNTSWGSTTWSHDQNGNWTQSQSLNPQLQGLMDTAVQHQQQGIDYGALPQLQDGSAARDQAIQGAYGQATSRLDPQWDQRQNALRTQLYNQGLREGDAGYDTQMANFGRDRNDAYSSAMNGAIAQGTSAGNSIFQNSLAGRQQMLGEANQQMNQPMQGLNGLLSGSGMLSMPGFSQSGNYLGAAQAQGQWDQQQQQVNDARMGGMFGGLGALGGSMLGGPVGGMVGGKVGGMFGGVW